MARSDKTTGFGRQETAGADDALQAGTPGPVRLDGGLRMGMDDLAAIDGLAGELFLVKDEVTRLKDQLRGNPQDPALHDRLGDAASRLESAAESIRNRMTRLRLVPADNLLAPCLRYALDSAASLGKDIAVETRGGDIPFDRSLMEALTGPFSHLVRNAVDGIEAPALRSAKGKRESGTIALSASRQGSRVSLEVGDDGRGLDTGLIRREALEKGLIGPETVLDDRTLLDLICAPGFTAGGVVPGMAAVKAAVESLLGTLEVSTVPDRGTKFVLTLPLSISPVRSLLVRAAGDTLAIPLNFVGRTLMLDPAEVEMTATGPRHDGLPVDRLTPLWTGVDAPGEPDRWQCVEIAVRGERRLLCVDGILEESDLSVKGIDPIFRRHPLIGAGSVLGDGQPVFLLNAPNLFTRNR
jgi:two-component system chemotaxis sensor kinase CheA